MQLPPKHSTGEFDFTPPQAIVNPDGSVEVWDNDSHKYITHYPGRPTPDLNHSPISDAEMFSPTENEHPANPVQTFGDPDATQQNSYASVRESWQPVVDNWTTPNRKMPGQWDAFEDESHICPHCGAKMDPAVSDYCKNCKRLVQGAAGIDHTPIMDHMTECPHCGTPTAEAVCPRCGTKLDHTWEYRQEEHDPSPFNDNVPKEDYHHYDMMVPWGSGGGGALSHTTDGLNSERTSMDERTQSALNRVSIGKPDVDLNDCPECSQPMIKRAGEGYEFCPSCGHKNKVIDTTMAHQAMGVPAPGVMCPQCHQQAMMLGTDPTGNTNYQCPHCGNRFSTPGTGVAPTHASLQKGSPYPENDDEVDHSAPGHNLPDKVNEIYNAVKREHPEYDKSKAMAIAWSRSGLKKEEKAAGLWNEVKNLGGDTAQLGEDIYNHPTGVPGDVLNMGADVGKGVAYGIHDHPLMAAALAAPFALPLAGAGLAAAPLIGEAAGAGDLGLAGGLAGDAAAQGIRGGLANYAGLASRIGIGGGSDVAAAGEGDAAAGGASIPQRAKNLLGGARNPGIAFSVGHELGSLQGGGAGTSPGYQVDPTPAGAYASTNPNGGRRLTLEELEERRVWSKDYDLFSHLAADDDNTSDISVRTDGDDVTDPQTQGSQEETGDSLDELLKSLGDDGSANAANYTPEQTAAVHHFNDNLPTILAFNMHEADGKGHDIIEAVVSALEKAFGEKIDGGSGESTVEKSDDSDTSEPKEEKSEKKSAMPVQAPQQTPGAMQPQQQTSVTPCAICGGPHPTDQHPSAVNPPTQGGQFGMASKVELLEHVAARRPKMCPYHSELVDFSLTTGDPFQARQAVRPSDYGEGAVCGKAGGAFEGGCNYKPGMVTQEYWDQRDQAAQERREQRDLQQQQTQQHEQELPSETFEGEGGAEAPLAEGTSPSAGDLETAVGVGTMNNPDAVDNALQMAASMIREANILPQGWKLNLEMIKMAGPEHDHVQPHQHGPVDHHNPAGVEVGKTYELHSNQYSAPDTVNVKDVKPDGSVTITFQFEGGLESQPHTLTPEQLADEGIRFEPLQTQDVVPELREEPKGTQEDSAPDANETTDLSASFEGEEPEDDNFVDGLAFTDEHGEPVDYATYASRMREIAPPDMQWLWDDVKQATAPSRRQKEMQAVIAGRQFTQREQSDLINEQGKARNSDKLDLKNTHYDMGEAEVPDEHFMLGL